MPKKSLGVTAPAGFKAAAVAAGIRKADRLDMALVVSDYPAKAVGLFTTNQIVAAPVKLSQTYLRASKTHRAVLFNSGCANACTGAAGLADARQLCRQTARWLGCRPAEVLNASTGIIGPRLPLPRMLKALPQAVAGLSSRQGPAAARAIMTTDTWAKQAETAVTLSGTRVRIGGMAKGSGMIHPQLATLLAMVTTDVFLGTQELSRLLNASVAGTFNAISVDGQNSTNDSVFLMANGAAGVRSQPDTVRAQLAFLQALTEVMDALADAVVRDGEGASKWIEINVEGARNQAEAMQAARAIGDSQLVKTAIYGHDANWGRMMQALGATSVGLKPDAIAIDVNGVALVRKSMDAGTPWVKANRALHGREIRILVKLGMGRGRARYRTCDLTEAYVRINAGYRS